ncbi:S-layer homology domain-containing protein [Metasolibacillus sp. FSL H7-0170]|uniref:S-layer homology domain-containing protein n=1 Tax=Metasolibacillus sp. FSL H7-0170 TaxID=2921431 RepID=UPI0031591E06
MTIWKKQLHIALVFILVLSLFSPVSVIKAQHLEGEINELNIENTNEISDSNLDNLIEQDNAIEPNNEIELEDSTEQDNVLKSESELGQQIPLGDSDGLAPFMEFTPLLINAIQLNPEGPLLLKSGDTAQLTASIPTTDDSAIITWTSSNPEVAAVDADGLITAVGIGDTEITATVDTISKTVKVQVVPEAVKEISDLIIALPDELEPTEAIYQQLLAIREKEAKLQQLGIRNIFDTTPYQQLLRQKEANFAINYMTDPTNATPPVEQITTLDANLSAQLEEIRKVYTSLFNISGRWKPTDSTLEALDHALAEKEVKYAILAIDALPEIEDLTVNPIIKESLDYARKKYNGITSVRTVPNPWVPSLPPVNQPFKDDVTNKQELFAKEAKYVALLIDAIDVTSPFAFEQLKAAKDAYQSLLRITDPGNWQSRIGNYNTLLEKEKILNAEGDINLVISKIDALPSVETLVWADRSKVIEAQLAYDQLLDEFKTRVTNYAILEALQKRLIELQPPTVDAYHAVANYLLSSSAIPTYGSEWTILTLARGDNSDKYKDYYEQYYSNLVKHVKATNGKIGSQSTDWSRVIIALTAIGKDPRDVGGYNLVEKLTDYNFAISPGINSAVYSLIALDTWAFDLPETATTTRDKLIDYILSKEIKGVGGFALSGSNDDADVTGMTLQALAPYYQSNIKVKEVIDRAIAKLAIIQLPNGGYKSADFSSFKGSENPESAAQVVTALVSLGIDVNKDERFNKVISNIMTYQSTDGGFKHVHSQTNANGMATVQVGYTLAAYNRLLSGQTTLYDMSDTKDNPSKPDDGDDSDEEEPSPPDNNGNPPTVPSEKEEIGYATVSIRISSNEVPLRATATKLFAGETAFDVLRRVTEENGIALSYRQTEYGVYIDGIAGLYEFDRGALSGWMYRVNGHFPSYSAANYVLSANDSVEWLYTTDLGKDVGGYVDGIESGGAGGTVCAEDDEECKEKQCPESVEDCETEQAENVGETTVVDSAVTEITVEAGSNKAVITSENIQEYLEKNIQTLIVQSENNFKVEVPTATFAGIQLAEDENVVISVTKQPENNQFTVNFGIETADGRLKPLSTKQDYLKVTIPSSDISPKTVVLQLVGGQYKAVPHKIVDGQIIVLTKTSGTFVVTESSVTFNDIAHLANKEEIEYLASRLVIQGVTPDTFEPNKPITRAQFAALVSRALGLQLTGENPFSDTDGKWYERDVQALFEAGITNGTTTSTFDPEAHITREQAAALMARVLEYVNYQTQTASDTNYNDQNLISSEYQSYIELLNSLDIMTGKPDGSFDPKSSLTRDQTAKILKRTLMIIDMM